MGHSATGRNKKRWRELEAVIALADYGIQPGDALQLIDRYNHLDDFLANYKEVRKRQKILDRLEGIEDFRMALKSNASEGGFQEYKQWRFNELDKLKPKEKKTLFEVLKTEETENLFHKLKRV